MRLNFSAPRWALAMALCVAFAWVAPAAMAQHGIEQIQPSNDDRDKTRIRPKVPALNVWSNYESIPCFPKLSFRVLNRGKQRNPALARSTMAEPYGTTAFEDSYEWRVEFASGYDDEVFFDYEVAEDSVTKKSVQRKGRTSVSAGGTSAKPISVTMKTYDRVFVRVTNVRFIEDNKKHPYAECQQ